MSVSQLIENLNCYVSVFPESAVNQDLMTKKTIGEEHESGGNNYMSSSKATHATFP